MLHHQLAPAQNMNTAENYGNNSSKGPELLPQYKTLYVSYIMELIVTN